MCGIVGYTGPREAGPILIEGLQAARIPRLRLGRDRARRRGRRPVRREEGRQALEPQTALADRTPHAAIGLAHTRWATHGRPNDLNAHPAPGLHGRHHGHPQRDHRELPRAPRRPRRRAATRSPRRPTPRRSPTSSRRPTRATWPTRCERRSASSTGPTRSSSCTRNEISRLVGARENVPLVVGLHGEESFIASDVAAILAHTNRIVYPRGGRRGRRPARPASSSPTSTATSAIGR